MNDILIFDYDYYYGKHKDVLSAGMDGLDHFARHGRFENRDFRSGIDLHSALEEFIRLRGEYERNEFIEFAADRLCRAMEPAGEDVLARQALEALIANPRQSAAESIACKLSPSVNIYHFSRSENSRPRVNMIVPTLDDSAIYGGIRTAIDFFIWLVKKLPGSVDFRIISQNDDNFGVAVQQMVEQHGFIVSDAGADDERIVVSGSKRETLVFPLRHNDLFITTFWATSVAVQGGLDAVESSSRICHFLQDYEPNFYAASSLQQMCLSSLQHERNALYIANSNHLAEFIGANCSLRAPCIPFTPRINPGLLPGEPLERSNAVLFYARKNPRNLFEIGRLALARFHELHSELASQFQWIGIGDISGSYPAGTNSTLHCIGKLTLEQYRAWMARARVGLSLMMAPHPSYPPLEMAYNGLRVVTNDFGTKRMSDVHPNIESADEPTPAKICDLLYKQCLASLQNPPLVEQPFRGQLVGFETASDPFAHLLENEAFKRVFFCEHLQAERNVE